MADVSANRHTVLKDAYSRAHYYDLTYEFLSVAYEILMWTKDRLRSVGQIFHFIEVAFSLCEDSAKGIQYSFLTARKIEHAQNLNVKTIIREHDPSGDRFKNANFGPIMQSCQDTKQRYISVALKAEKANNPRTRKLE